MAELETLTLFELKELCKEQGLAVKGTKKDLITRLQNAESTLPPENTNNTESESEDEIVIEVAEKDESPASVMVKETEPVALNVAPVEKPQETYVDPYLNSQRISALKEKLVIAMKGKGQFSIDTDEKTVHFHGSPRGLECTTLCAPDQSIERVARTYVGRVFIGKNNLTSM